MVWLLVAVAQAGPLEAGERLEWGVSWLGVEAGHAWSELTAVGAGTWTIEAGCRSAGWLSGLYPIDDHLLSEPGRYTTRFREGRYQRDEVHAIGADATVVTRTQLVDGAWKTWEDHYGPAPGAFDPLAAFYRLRLDPAPVGGETTFPLWTGRRRVDLHARTVGTETYDGRPVLRVQVRSGEDGPDIKDRLTVLLTDDADRVPLLAVVATRAGDVEAKLVSRKAP